MPDFGTYEGHRIMSDAAQKTADRIQRGHQFRLQNELDERSRKDSLEHIRDQGVRMDHLNTLTDKQVWEIGQMTPENIRNIRSQITERDTLLDPRVKNILSTVKERDTLRDPTAENIKSQTNERDTLLDPRVQQLDAQTDNLISTARARDEEQKALTQANTRDATSRTDYRDESQTPNTDAQTSGMIQSQEQQEHNFQRQQIDENKADLTENIRKEYYMRMSDKLDDLDIYDEDANEFRGDAAALMVQAIDNAYPQDIAKLDPNGKLDLSNINDIGADVQKLYTNETMNRVMSEISQAGLTKEQIQELIDSDPKIKGYFDAFYRQGLGVNQEDNSYGPLTEALGYGANTRLTKDQQFDKVDDYLKNLPHDDRVYTQLNDNGQVEIVEEDMAMGSLNDDTYTVKWDKGKPYIVGDENKQIYLDDQEELVAEFD